MKWANILHLYQPPTQTKEVVDLVAEESYRNIISLLDGYPRLRLTINISGSLLELLEKYGHTDVIAGLRRHAERGAIELMGSAMYHPILPLLSPFEIKRQIRLHDEISKRCFGDAYKPRGFYMPEMAYGAQAAKVVKELGFEWTVLDEIHATDKVDPATRHSIEGVGLVILFRDSKISRTFPPETIVKGLADGLLVGANIVTCHDGEVYGHWHKNDHGYYKKAFANPDIDMLCASEYLDSLAASAVVAIREASWESRPEELAANIAHGLWNDPLNAIHASLEGFKRDVLVLVEANKIDPGYDAARHRADRGVASCAWWWASERKLGPFSPLTWNPTEIEKGATELFAAVEALKLLEPATKAAFEARYKSIRKAVWGRHREKHDPSYPVIE